MAHFAEIDSENKVIRVLAVDNENADDGQTFLAETVGLGGTWIQTSYNTYGGVHRGPEGEPDGGIALRKNYAGIGYSYDSVRDAFIPPQPSPSAVLDDETCLWKEVE